MTKLEIEQNGKWINKDIYQILIFSPFFQKEVKVNFYYQNPMDKKLINSAYNNFISFLNLKLEEKDKIEEEIWQHCLACNQTQTSKGSRDGGKTWFDTSTTLEENLKRFNILTKIDALNLYTVEHVFIYNEPKEDIKFEINIDTPCDWVHLLMFLFNDGKFVRMEN
jgi:hypothetical protein